MTIDLRDLDPNDVDGSPLPLDSIGDQRSAVHVFERRELLAVRAAITCGRPLLVRGEPGVGKSQLARAVAKRLGRVFLSRFVDARTEAHDLLWSHDAISRLAEAQAWGHRMSQEATDEPSEQAEPQAKPERLDPTVDLAPRRFVVPGPMWWALNWDRAVAHVGAAKVKVPEPRGDGDPKKGVVLLIDEIDKANASVPNGLLECLGQGMFTVPGIDEPIHATKPLPLVVFSSNDERTLPPAFLRRCVVLWLGLPKGHDAIVRWLVKRGEAHFPPSRDDQGKAERWRAQIREAAHQVATDRAGADALGVPPPGLAEFIDLLAVLVGDPSRSVEELAEFFLHKHVEPQRGEE